MEVEVGDLRFRGLFWFLLGRGNIAFGVFFGYFSGGWD